jgi:CRISPR-associated protein Csm4
MAEFDRYVLQLTAPLHLAGRGIGLEESELTVRSDTLFSALCVAIAATRGTAVLNDLLDWHRAGEIPFVISSSFPWAGELFLLPRPRLVAPGGEARRARWVTPRILGRLLQGDSMTGADGAMYLLRDPLVWVDPADTLTIPPLPWWRIDDTTRVTIDRMTQASSVYRSGRAYFRTDAGLYFLVHWREPAWRPVFDEALAYLEDAGLGGERSAGHGQFRLVRHDRLAIGDTAEASLRYTLGLYHPSPDEVSAGALDPPAAFDIEVRGGWITGLAGASVWRKAVRMLTEGALVRTAKEAPGDLVAVTPEHYDAHPIFRHGLALTLGAALASE